MRNTVQLKISSYNFIKIWKKIEPLKKVRTLKTFWPLPLWSNYPHTWSLPFLCSMDSCSTISERSIHLNTSYYLETRYMLLFAPKSCMNGAITPKLKPSIPFVIWKLMVHCQISPHSYIQIIVQQLQKCLFLTLKGKFAIFYLWFKYVHYDIIYIFTKFNAICAVINEKFNI